jgi:serine protease Do
MDLALLQAEGLFGQADLPPIKVNRDPMPPVGTPIAAIGNPLKAFRTMTTGIVSITGDYQGSQYILFDAQIGKGNSGGPLINAQGELLGVVVEIITQNGANLGKALSTAEIDYFMKMGKEGFLGVSAKKAKTGLSGYGLSEGLQVTAESRDTPFEINDIIMTFKDYPMDNYDDLIRIVRREQPGSQVEATVLRNGDLKILKVDIVECPVPQK